MSSSKKSPASKPANSQSNTILNYFGRTPSKTPNNGEAKTPLKSLNGLTSKASKANLTMDESTPKTAKGRIRDECSTPSEQFKSPKQPRLQSNGKPNNTLQLFEVVWAKLEGYPWWPAIICEDPAEFKFEAKGEIHVQFFDDPVSHSWIKKRDIKPYNGSLQPGPISTKTNDPKLKFAIESADQALEVDREARFTLIGNLTDNDYENNEDSMSVDNDQSNSSENNIATPAKRKKSNPKDERSYDLDDDEVPTKLAKRKRIQIDSSDDDDQAADDYKPPAKEEESSDESFSDANSEDVETPEDEDDDVDEVEEEEVNTKKRNGSKKASLNNTSKRAKQPASKNANASKKSFSMSTTSKANNTTNQAATYIEASDRDWPHLSHEFLKPENIRDSQQRKMLVNDELNPDYDMATLFVPRAFLDKQTPAQRQWWELKAEYFDTILFFKMGKFYELFHMDAVTAAKELHILFMKGDYAHAGFPEKSYKRHADVLIQNGYKVARIEQTETPAMMEQRVKKMNRPTKFDKVVNREVCRVSSPGTRYMSDIDSDVFAFSNSYLVAFSYQKLDDVSFEFGLSFVDASIGKFYLTQFKDDKQFSKLRTILSFYQPIEIIYTHSTQFAKFFESIYPNARKQSFKKFTSPEITLKYISENNFWKSVSHEFKEQILDPSDVLSQTCKPEYSLAISSLGGMIYYLGTALIAHDLLSMGLFELYIPPDSNTSDSKLTNHLILDSVTLKNLEIFDNLGEDESNSLYKVINSCCTYFGKRLLRSWLCMPLCNLRGELEDRQQAVRDLAENMELLDDIPQWRIIMRKLPDLERLLTQIHTQGSLKRSQDHPDSRAILFEGDIYRRRRIVNFLNALDGFENIVKLFEKISEKSSSIESKLLLKMFDLQTNEDIAIMREKITFFHNAFNAEEARKEGKIIPASGVDAEYDEALEQIREVKQKLENYLKKQIVFFGSRSVKYANANKDRYLIEIPDSYAEKATKCTQEEYELKSTRKGFKRFHTPTITELLTELDCAEERIKNALGDIFRRLLEQFDSDYQLWARATQSVARLDALMSLAKTKQIFDGHGAASCLPQFVWSSTSGPVLDAKEMRNACLMGKHNNLIPNDISLFNGTLVLTGPNMAGKTTLMRSVGLLVVLAQIGSYVPAHSCSLTPVDRIFTRIGAYDQVIESQSTFMIELSETVTILRHSTVNSLVLIDELGRGTSTFDGIAIAHSVLEELAQSIQCRCIFSTHFHSIVDDLLHTDGQMSSFKIGHMDYVVKNVNKDDPTDEDVVFLYKLKEGVCSKSYGYNVAKMAGLPRDVIRSAYKAGHAFELKVESCRLLDAFIQSSNGTSKRPLTDDKIDQLAQYLSEIIITQESSKDINLDNI